MHFRKFFRHLLLDMNTKPRSVVMGVGLCVGMFVAVVVRCVEHVTIGEEDLTRRTRESDDTRLDEVKYILQSSVNRDNGDDRLSIAVDRKTRVLCWLMIKKGDNSKALAANATWCQRCDHLLFFGLDLQFGAIDVGVPEGENFLAEKTFACLSYIYKHYIDEADWFLKVDDDTFVVMENLKYFLSDQDPHSAVTFGEYFNPYGGYIHYNSGGAGYVLSKGALRRFGEEVGREGLCAEGDGPEDRALGYCLESLGVQFGNTLDRFGRSRFHYSMPHHRVSGDDFKWYKLFVGERYKKGMESMSTYPISFHYLEPHDMHVLEYRLYRLTPYGRTAPIIEVNG